MGNIPAFANWSVESIATYLTATMFGWKAEAVAKIERPVYTDEVSELLSSLPNMGTKLVNKLLTVYSPLYLLRLVAEKDIDALMQVSGIGEKRAEKFVNCCSIRAQILFDDLSKIVEQEIRDTLRTSGEQAAQAVIESNLDWMQMLTERPLYEKTSEDREVERFFSITEVYWDEDEHGFPTERKTKQVEYPTWIFNNMPYLTYDGNGGELDTQFNKTAAGFDPKDLADLGGNTYTSTWNFVNSKCDRNFHLFAAWMWRNKSDMTKLTAGWKRMWKRYFQVKDTKAELSWLTPRQLDTIKQTFLKLGVMPASRRNSVSA